MYSDPFFLFSSQFQTLQLFSLLLSLPHFIFHDSSHHLCSFCLHHPSIVVLQSLGLPFSLVISVKSLPFNCHFWNSSPLGDRFFSLQCLFCSLGRQFFHLCHLVSSPLERAVSVLTPTKSFEGTSSNNDLPCPAVGPISFPDTWMLFFSLYSDFIHRIFFSLLPLIYSTDAHLPTPWLFNQLVWRTHNHSFTDINGLNFYYKVIVTII